jgi:hypothetical protein
MKCGVDFVKFYIILFVVQHAKYVKKLEMLPTVLTFFHRWHRNEKRIYGASGKDWPISLDEGITNYIVNKLSKILNG